MVLMSSLIGPSSVRSAFLLRRSSMLNNQSLSVDRSKPLSSLSILSRSPSTHGNSLIIILSLLTSSVLNYGPIDERSIVSPECLFSKFLIKLISESKVL